jgi:protein tyrosine phosphatase
MKISVFGTVRRLREQRWKMVYNLTQYKFVYDFTIIEIAKMFSKENIN